MRPSSNPVAGAEGEEQGAFMRIALETDRLVLREFTANDVDLIVELDSDPEVTKYLTGGVATPLEEVRDDILPYWLRLNERDDGFGYWAAIERDTDTFLGWFHFRPGFPGVDGTVSEGIELGYRFRRAAWGNGYATEGSIALVDRGFTDLGVERVFAQTMTANLASRRVMEKAGLRYFGEIDPGDEYAIPGDELGGVEYALTKREWEAARS